MKGIPRSIRVLVWLVVIVIISYLFLTTFIFKRYFYYSPNKKSVVTRLEYLPIFLPQSTYFTLGKYYGITPPNMYIRPIYSGRDGGFVLLMHWTDNGCVLFYPYGNFHSNELTNQFQLRESKAQSQEWKMMRHDTLSGNNKLLTEFIF